MEKLDNVSQHFVTASIRTKLACYGAALAAVSSGLEYQNEKLQ